MLPHNPGSLRLAQPVLLLTRPEPQSRAFAAALADAGPFRLVISPLIGIAFTGALPEMEGFAGLIFTSVNGVAAYVDRGGPPLPAYTVGEATAEAARDAGMQATAAEGNAETLIALLKDLRPQGPLLHVRGRHSRGDVAGRLSAAGLPVRAAILYDQPALPPTPEATKALSGHETIVAPVFSPRTGALLSELDVHAPLLVAAMSEAVAKALAPLHKQDLKIASRPDSAAMRELVADLLRRARAGEH